MSKLKKTVESVSFKEPAKPVQFASPGKGWNLLEQKNGKCTFRSSNGKQIMKVYKPATPSEYIQLEAVLSRMLEVRRVSSPRIEFPSDYKPLSSSPDTISILRNAGCSTLQEQLEVLGKKREFSLEIIWTIISDVAEAIRVGWSDQDLNDQSFFYLGLKPENIILTDDNQYKIADLFFNDYVIQAIKKSEEQRTQEKLTVFPHLSGKKEHTVVYFNKDGNEYINSKIRGREERSKPETKADVWNPYVAPEALDPHLSILGYSETFQKADSFSVGMLFLRLLCSLTDTPFEQFAHLNKQTDDSKYSEVLYEIVKFGEREKLERELGVLIPLIMKDTFYRMVPEKIYTTVQAEFL